MPTVVLIGTLDTKGVEYDYVRRRLREAGCDVLLVDSGVQGEPLAQPDVTRQAVARAAGADVAALAAAGDRGAAMLTCPYVFGPEDARAMAEAGADVLVPHMGLTTKGVIGARTALTLDECGVRIQAMHDAAKAVNPEILVLCHGGPIAEPEDAAYVLERTVGVVGFFGASSMERLPTEVAITENARRFKQLRPSL